MSDDDYDDDVEDDDDIEDDDGIQEAHAGGKALKDAGYKFDVAHTSVLQVIFDHGYAVEFHDVSYPVLKQPKTNEYSRGHKPP